ncbi:uncharacterized protein LOC115787690 isoform X2 [Archocentrus centrarchus]|uniref:uncharacterized protein LOC115779530 isoform X2 n=1 Tax=Archocentrus centrarchus TaxID=63155 RepID=UPI0011E9CDDD|nr:uncharacterized protein LOC115779530 isoform X2 [Archocentrus centrarchus]XP_030584143.1 uncharacterized protein LOC115779548 isoform X2 [Archocentrus centrarchus]XP_030596327.1 uncharacterized protein LOC115787690 isoform X2 [Archocentrus centrarchus]
MEQCGTVVHADGQNSLTGNFREDITLITGAAQLHDEYQIIWSHVQKVLINYDNREWVTNAANKYQLDTKTGSLTIRSLIANDSGLYQVQIFSGSKRTAKTFNLSVVGAPSKYPPTPAQNPSADDASQTSSSADQRPTDPDPNPPTGPPQPLGIIGLVGLFLGLGACTVLVIIKREPIKGFFRGRFTPCKPEDPGKLEQEQERDTLV